MARKTKELEKEEVKATKKVTKKKSISTKKNATTTIKKTTKKSSKVATKNITSKKSNKNSKTTTKRVKKELNTAVKFKSEYYDLPFMYNKTVVKVLAQTPKMLFIYWEVAEDDRNKLKELYGNNFFETTKPVLIVYNDTLHYSFEVNIDDFANSWYLHINDANCNYHVELGRRPYPDIYQNNSKSDTKREQSQYIPYYIYLTASNEMAAPNNKILFDPNAKSVRFKNVKTGQSFERDISQFKFITNFGIFNIQDLYKSLYPNEDFTYENIVLGNTSSGSLSSSGMFSSQFK